MIDFFYTYFIPICIFIPVLVGLFLYKSLSGPLKIIFYYSLFSFVVNTANNIGIAYNQTSILASHIYNIGEFVFLSLYYCTFFKTKRRLIYILIGLFEIFCAIDLFHLQTNVFNTYVQTGAAAIYIGYSIGYMFKQANIDVDERWASNPFNWINLGILLYYAIGLVVFAVFNWLTHLNRVLFDLVWVSQNAIFCLQFILFAIAFYKAKTLRIALTE